MNNKMRPKMGSQPAANFIGGGLPVCLSGIGIHSRLQPSNRYPRLHHRHEATRRWPYSRQNSITDCEVHHVEAALGQRLREISLSENFVQGGPRHALSLQMADLDRRREAIRKRRTNHGVTNLMQDQRSVLDQRNDNRMNTVIRVVMQLPSFQHEFDRELMCHGCAKAA
ncbi:hypothetical protein SUGI_0597610 [Cryptomeria japonica]|uniref:uncharacterized protein LOC131061579 n=1 Tax=Cryptomeria japonica TaxID=3369 RepID=UPI002414A2A5|nr:uncharacterized protein LOC131061579 [Cryptomeria japonica]XP_059063220.1 uncharacterized protein LOC131061579 [Cryptomeria japonica]GLJ30206.1 hypothetical protein SUGI_0597610 [Cryptomeria japonica]